MEKTMRKKNIKIQMLAGNSLKICIGASSQISTYDFSTVIRDTIIICMHNF